MEGKARDTLIRLMNAIVYITTATGTIRSQRLWVINKCFLQEHSADQAFRVVSPGKALCRHYVQQQAACVYDCQSAPRQYRCISRAGFSCVIGDMNASGRAGMRDPATFDGDGLIVQQVV